MKNFKFTLFILLLISGSLNPIFAQADENIVGMTATQVNILPNPVLNPEGFYTYRRDLRLCPSPLCGGFFVKKVNHKLTVCADGSQQNECYVKAINWSIIGTPPVDLANGNFLLHGTITKVASPPFGNIGTFNAKAVYRPATNKSLNPASLFVGLQNNGLVCITSPCFSFDEQVLNTSKTRLISSINLQNVGATANQLAAANKRLADGKVLLAAGRNAQYSEPFGVGISFEAKQFYLPVKRPAGIICPDGYILNGSQCVTPTIGCVAPKIELEAFGGAAYIDPITGEIKSSVTRSCVDTCTPPGILDKPAHCVVFYP